MTTPAKPKRGRPRGSLGKRKPPDSLARGVVVCMSPEMRQIVAAHPDANGSVGTGARLALEEWMRQAKGQ